MSISKYRPGIPLKAADDIPTVCNSLSDIKKICKFYGIQDSVEYRVRYRDIPGLVAHPERVFQSDWISYNDLLDIPEPYRYNDLKMLLKDKALKSKRDFIRFVNDVNDPRIPRDPQSVYGSDWESWYRFLGKVEPYKVSFIDPEYIVWGEKINEFMKQAFGAGTKVSLLCRFVRDYIEGHDKSITPQAFLTKAKINIKPFRVVLKNLPSENMRRNIVVAVNEFLDFVIENDLTVEDEETGEIIRIMEARNPFALLGVERNVYTSTNSETTKPCLPFHFVKNAQGWIIPEGLKTFSDLKHLHKFNADWVKVPESLIDKSDADCVYKKLGEQYFLWSPVDWLHTYALTCVPLRGRQIAYNDSGEADEFLADVGAQGDIIWSKNQGVFAGMTKNQSFIKKMADAQIGMFITTNKTSNQGVGYSIPWIPVELAKWLVRLRKWQQKYNSISKPTSWTQCKRTNLNELQLKAKGVNCFLFRAFGDIEPKNVSSALTPRLAAALYSIQPSELALSTLSGSENILSHYKSKYTPHSMRVSLITAYIMEHGMPVEIVMKIVGHSSIVMSIYYCKVTENDIRQRLEEGEKIALKSKAGAVQKLIEQNRLEEVKNQLVSNNSDLLLSLSNEVPAGNFMFRDYGICPYAASRCDDGGEIVGSTQVRTPVPVGYLGMQNCIRCRHFITGPAFYGGLLSITNEVLLQSNYQSSQCAELQLDIDNLSDKINQLERQEYIANAKDEIFDSSCLAKLEFELRKLESEYECSAKKMDVFLCDLQACYKLIQMSQASMDELSKDGSDNLSLIKMSDAELVIDLAEVSYFQQLQEVCENATIFQSASASSAVAPRSQLLDRMSQFNEIAPQMFLMEPKQQLEVGNQLVKLLFSRLNSWERVSEIVECEVRISDLIGTEKITPSEIELITHQPRINLE
jgi:hypothetical protein